MHLHNQLKDEFSFVCRLNLVMKGRLPPAEFLLTCRENPAKERTHSVCLLWCMNLIKADLQPNMFALSQLTFLHFTGTKYYFFLFILLSRLRGNIIYLTLTGKRSNLSGGVVSCCTASCTQRGLQIKFLIGCRRRES